MRPRSVQRPIPIWLGGNSEAAVARAARIADGAMPSSAATDAQAQALVAQFRAFVDEAGRSRDEVGLNTFFALRAVPREQWSGDATGWRELRVTHLTVEAEQAGLGSPQAQIDTLRHVHEAISARRRWLGVHLGTAILQAFQPSLVGCRLTGSVTHAPRGHRL